MHIEKVIVVGAGPSGLLLALLLARAGIRVELVEMSQALDTNPRATHYPEAACYELDRAGVLDQVRAEGFSPSTISWRKLDENKTRLTRLGGPPPPGEEVELNRHRMVCLPLHRLGKILEAAVDAQPTATIHYGHKVVDVEQEKDGRGPWIKVETSSGLQAPQWWEASYIVGCDGASSKIRSCLFGDGVFPGHTWNEQIVATNMYYDFSPYDYDDSQFFVDHEHWHMVAKIQADGLYRVTYGEISGLTTEQLRDRLPGKYKAFLPGAPDPGQYNLVGFSPYKVHQRCVDNMRVGKVLLAADAAHLCNPFGGMGLTGGIADVGCLYDSLLGIHTGLADDSILDKYDEVRRQIWHEVIDPVSSQNMRRLIDIDADEAVEKDPFLKTLKQMEQDPEFRKKMGGGPTVQHDMTQYYTSKV